MVHFFYIFNKIVYICKSFLWKPFKALRYFSKVSIEISFNPLNANPRKWSNTLKLIVSNLVTNCWSVFDHFVGLALKVLKSILSMVINCLVNRENFSHFSYQNSVLIIRFFKHIFRQVFFRQGQDVMIFYYLKRVRFLRSNHQIYLDTSLKLVGTENYLSFFYFLSFLFY